MGPQSRAGLVTRFQGFSSLVGKLACFAYLFLTMGIVSGA